MAKTRPSNKTQNDDLKEGKLVSIKRVSKVRKGGRTFSFSVLSVYGNGEGKVSYVKVNVKEIADVVKTAERSVKNQSYKFLQVPLREKRTIHHDVMGHFGASKVILRPAPPGKGIIAGGAMRAVLEALGVQDIVGKSIGSNNPHNIIRATMNALSKLNSPRQVAERRGKKVGDIIRGREMKVSGSNE